MQDRYPSDAYSEDPPDAESARRLLEFGEDYRNDLDSLSDCPSSLSAEMRAQRPHHHPYYKRSPPKRLKGPSSERSELRTLSKLDSDSDVDDLVHVVKTSSNQYTIALNTFYKAIQHSARPDASSQFVSLLSLFCRKRGASSFICLFSPTYYSLLARQCEKNRRRKAI